MEILMLKQNLLTYARSKQSDVKITHHEKDVYRLEVAKNYFMYVEISVGNRQASLVRVYTETKQEIDLSKYYAYLLSVMLSKHTGIKISVEQYIRKP